MALLYLIILLLSTSFAEAQKEITVSAAMSLKNAFEEIGKMYEVRNKGTRVRFNFGASGDLIRQIEGGAPVDVFASAAPNEMDELEKQGTHRPGHAKKLREKFTGAIDILKYQVKSTFFYRPDIRQSEEDSSRQLQDCTGREICRGNFPVLQNSAVNQGQTDFCRQCKTGT